MHVVIPTPKNPEFGADVRSTSEMPRASHFKLQCDKVTWLCKAVSSARVLVVGIRTF